MTSDFRSARLGIPLRGNLKPFIAENALPAQNILPGFRLLAENRDHRSE